MSWERIRPVALGVVFRNDDELLLACHHDEVAGHEFYRPLGGGVEFGEQSDIALRREFQEELGVETTVTDHIATFENIFEFRGNEGHEVVFLYEVALEDDHLYEQEAFEVIEDSGESFPARWKSLSAFTGADAELLYPGPILDHLTTT